MSSVAAKKTASKKAAASKSINAAGADAHAQQAGKKRQETYHTYIYRVLKDCHDKLGISSAAMAVMNSMVNDIFERIAREAAELARYNKRQTIGSKEIRSAVNLVFPGDLARHALSEAAKALSKYGDVVEN